MMTGIRHYDIFDESLVASSMIIQSPTFMMRSGRKVPTPAIPMPDLAVP
jgi:hypothetical protein